MFNFTPQTLQSVDPLSYDCQRNVSELLHIDKDIKYNEISCSNINAHVKLLIIRALLIYYDC
jgi:hypothetical protein